MSKNFSEKFLEDITDGRNKDAEQIEREKFVREQIHIALDSFVGQTVTPNTLKEMTEALINHQDLVLETLSRHTNYTVSTLDKDGKIESMTEVRNGKTITDV